MSSAGSSAGTLTCCALAGGGRAGVAGDGAQCASITPMDTTSIIAHAAHKAEALATAGDEQLMLAYAAGDVSAFERLYTRHARAVHRFIARLLRSDAAADDLLQDTWFAVARNAATYQPSARFTTWLYTIARSRVIDHVRAQRPSVSLDEPAGAGDEAPTLGEQLAADARDEPLRRLEGREDARTFLRALDALPDAQREAFLLQAEGDLSVEAIAQATGVGVETARSRLRYARARLRAHLAAAAANGVAR